MTKMMMAYKRKMNEAHVRYRYAVCNTIYLFLFRSLKRHDSVRCVFVCSAEWYSCLIEWLYDRRREQKKEKERECFCVSESIQSSSTSLLFLSSRLPVALLILVHHMYGMCWPSAVCVG